MIPFADWFRYATTALGLSPDAFWALTLDEWRWLAPEAEALGREGLLRLIAQYPDEARPPLPLAGEGGGAEATPGEGLRSLTEGPHPRPLSREERERGEESRNSWRTT